MNREAELKNLLAKIKPTEKSFAQEAQKNWDLLAHPPGSFGLLETMFCKLASIQKTKAPNAKKKCVCVFAADNGVFAEGVTSQPQITTFYLAESMLRGNTGLGAVSQFAKSDVFIYDAGLIKTSKRSEIKNIKLHNGTQNISVGNAMSRADCVEMVLRGIKTAHEIFIEDKYSLAGVGELGICNTTTSAAVLSALSEKPADETVGKGASTTQEMRQKKIAAVDKALRVNAPDSNDPIDCLSKVGGFDLATMCGFFLGAAIYNGAAVIDGFISTVAALCACRLNPLVKDYLFASHVSNEKGGKLASELLGLKPVLDLEMRLGEGTGCPLFFNILDTSLFVFYNMGKFTDTPISKNDLLDLRN